MGKVDFRCFMSSGAEKVIFQTSVSCTEITYFPVENNFPWYPLYSRIQGDSLKFPKRNFFQHFLSLLVAHSDFYIATYMSLPGGTCPRGVYQLLSSLYTVLVSPVSHKGLYPLDSHPKHTKIPCIGFSTWFSHHNLLSA